MHEPHVLIIGGGISGLSAAYFLSQKASLSHFSLQITLLEAAHRFGGVLRTLRGPGFHLEAGADAFDGKEPVALDLCRELGLQADLEACESTFKRIFISRKNALLPFDISSKHPWAMLRSPALSLKVRARLLFEGLIPSQKDDLDEDLETFMRRRFGGAFFAEGVEPLARGVLMAQARGLSMKEYFPQWRRMERESGSLTGALLKKKRTEGPAGSFFTLRDGLECLSEKLLKNLGRVELKPGTRAISLKRDTIWEVQLEEGRTLLADSVCVALPAAEAARLLGNAAPSLAGELSGIRYDPVLAVNMVFPVEEMPSFFPSSGFIVPSSEKKWPFASLKVIGKTGDGRAIKLRAFLSGVFQPALFKSEDEGVKENVLRCLAGEWGIKGKPTWISVERYPEALAEYGPGHGLRISRIEKS